MDADTRPQVGKPGAHSHARGQLPDVGPIAPDVQPAGPVQVIPLTEIVALVIKHLHPVILSVGNVHAPLGIGRHAVHQVKLPGIAAARAPRKEILSLGRVLVHAPVPIPIRDVKVTALGIKGNLGGPVKGLTAKGGCALARRADGQKHLPVRAALADAVPIVVHAPQRTIRTQGHPVGARKQPLAPRGDKTAVGLKHDHGMLAPGEHIHPVLGVYRNVDHLFEPPALGQLTPIGQFLIDVLATSQHRRHR